MERKRDGDKVKSREKYKGKERYKSWERERVRKEKREVGGERDTRYRGWSGERGKWGRIERNQERGELESGNVRFWEGIKKGEERERDCCQSSWKKWRL